MTDSTSTTSPAFRALFSRDPRVHAVVFVLSVHAVVFVLAVLFGAFGYRISTPHDPCDCERAESGHDTDAAPAKADAPAKVDAEAPAPVSLPAPLVPAPLPPVPVSAPAAQG
jgi:hypothetical protein